MNKGNVLIIEDDSAIREGLRRKLTLEGYRLSLAEDGEKGQQRLAQGAFDVVVLDLMLPKIDGVTLLREFRRTDRTTPVLILSARGSEGDKVHGLRCGADDYLSKPFGLEELIARLEALLRRHQALHPSALAFGLAFNWEQQLVSREGVPIELSKTEWQVLEFLYRHRNHAVRREQIQIAVWGETDVNDPRMVDYHVAQLRKKLEEKPRQPQLLKTRHRIGYVLNYPEG